MFNQYVMVMGKDGETGSCNASLSFLAIATSARLKKEGHAKRPNSIDQDTRNPDATEHIHGVLPG